jgi:broad specificity phosphatase PhoE
MAWWKQTIVTLLGEALDDSPESILVVSHAAFLWVLVEGLLDTGFRASCLATGEQFNGFLKNTGIITINVYDESHGDIVSYGDIAHLEELVEQNPENIVKDNADGLEARKMSEENR